MHAAAVVLLGAGACRALLSAGAGREVAGRLDTEGPARARWRAPLRLRGWIDDAALPVHADQVWTAWAACTPVLAIIAMAAGGPALAILAVAVAVAGPAALLLALRGRSARAVDAALPELLDEVARSLRSGAAIGQALDEASRAATGRLGADITAVIGDVSNGAALVAALDGWMARCPTRGVRLAVAALALAAESGGAAAKAIDGVAATLRANLAAAGEVRAQAAQARLSALVIALAPLAFGALAAGTDRHTAAFLLRTPLGLGCLTAGLLLDGAAAWWMHRITEAPA